MNLIDPVDECIYEINDIMALITKGDKWTTLANRLSKLLINKWNDEQKEAVRDVIRFLANGAGKEITKEEFQLTQQELEEKLGARLAEVFRKDVTKVQLESYSKGHTNVGIDFEFNTVDKKALLWLFEKDIKQFWIGDSYTHRLNDQLNKVTEQVLKAGLGRDEAAKLYKASLGDQFDKTNNYWELMANHTVTRSREFGRTSAYEKAGVGFIKIFNPSPESEICKFLNGKIIPVSRAIEQRDKLLTADSVEKVKKIAPWYSEKQGSRYQNMRRYQSGKVPKSVGLPPYHGHCKTTTVVAYPGESEIS